MSIAVPNLPVSDLAASKSFYVDRLGFRTVFESTEDGRSGLIGLERDGMRINIDSPMDGHGRNACVSLEVDDVDSIYAAWANQVGATVGVVDQPWGARTFEFQDPDGNTVFVLGSKSW